MKPSHRNCQSILTVPAIILILGLLLGACNTNDNVVISAADVQNTENEQGQTQNDSINNNPENASAGDDNNQDDSNTCSTYDTKLDYGAESYIGSAPAGKAIISVTLKTSTECLTFTADTTNDCYAINGVGTRNMTAARISTGAGCKAINHVEINYGGGDDQYVHICHMNEDGSYDFLTVLDDESLSGHDNHPDDIYPVPAEGCPQEEKIEYIQFCHMNTQGNYEVLTVEDDGTLGGHDEHEEDIFPIPPDGCPGKEKIEQVCHATGSEVIPYLILSVPDDGSLSGHADHPDDIIPVPEEGCPKPELKENICIDFIIFHTFRDGDLEIYRLDGTEEAENHTLINLSQGPKSEDSRPSRSWDDRSVVFESNRDGNIELYMNSTAGGTPTRLTETNANNINPMFTFDSQILVYQSDRNGSWDIYSINIETGEEQQLTTDPADETFPYTSPDPDWITYQSHRSGNWDVYLLNIRTGEEIQFTSRATNETFPTWSPNGEYLAFLSDSAGYNDLWVYNIITGEKFLVSEDDDQNANNHAWSPIGTRIAFQSNQAGNLDVYTFDLDEEKQYRLTNFMGMDSSPAWDCGGTNVSFTSIRDGAPNIFEVFWKGGNQTNMTIHPATDKWSEWSPGKEQGSRGH